LTEHTRAVEDICFEDYTYTTFYSCSSDSTIKKWNLQTGECLYTFTGHLTSVYKILCDVEENNLWSGNDNISFFIISIINNIIIFVIFNVFKLI